MYGQHQTQVHWVSQHIFSWACHTMAKQVPQIQETTKKELEGLKLQLNVVQQILT